MRKFEKSALVAVISTFVLMVFSSVSEAQYGPLTPWINMVETPADVPAESSTENNNQSTEVPVDDPTRDHSEAPVPEGNVAPVYDLCEDVSSCLPLCLYKSPPKAVCCKVVGYYGSTDTEGTPDFGACKVRKARKPTPPPAPVSGPKGDPGEKGDSGRDGRDGRDGVNGAPGRDGQNGKDGTVVHLTPFIGFTVGVGGNLVGFGGHVGLELRVGDLVANVEMVGLKNPGASLGHEWSGGAQVRVGGSILDEKLDIMAVFKIVQRSFDIVGGWMGRDREVGVSVDFRLFSFFTDGEWAKYLTFHFQVAAGIQWVPGQTWDEADSAYSAEFGLNVRIPLDKIF